MKNDPSGSQWRKWDLHFHTPASYDYKNKSVTNKDIIETLKRNKVSVVAITDHHVMDVERINELKRLGGDDITVFPGIEFRSELGGSEMVHFIGIFSETCDVETLWTKLAGKLNVTPKDVENVGDDKVYVSFVTASEIIHELGGMVSIHAGRKSNSIDNITNTKKFQMAFKRDLAERHVDLFEVGSTRDVNDYKRKVMSAIQFPLPVIVGSDNHNIHSYEVPTPCWIKADCTFAGLAHVLHEPDNRVYVGEVPPSMKRVELNPTKYMKSISVRKRDDAVIEETWFDCEIPFNSGLIAVVGNKGNGKSALADIVGLLGNTKNSDSFSFLSPKKFRQPKNSKAESFVAVSKWVSGRTRSRGLSDRIEEEEVEEVNYIPQDYLEGVCNELSGEPSKSFDNALRQVIYSHVEESDRLGFASLDDLLDYKTKETTEAIRRHQGVLSGRIKHFLNLLEQSSPSHKKTLINQRDAKRAELKAHDDAEPVSVTRPDSDDSVKKSLAEIERQLSEQKQLIEAIDLELTEKERRKARLSKQLASVEKLLKRLDNLDATVNTFRAESEQDCQLLEISVDDLFIYGLNRQPAVAKRQEVESELQLITAEVRNVESEGLVGKKTEAQAEIKLLNDKLDAPNRRFQEYLSSHAKWKSRRHELIGSETTVGTLIYLDQQLLLLDGLASRIEEAWGNCKRLSLTIFNEIERLADSHRFAFTPVQEFVERHPLAKDNFDLKFEAALNVVGFVERFLAYINQARRGSYCGAEEGRQRIEALVATSDFKDSEGICSFLDQIMFSMTSDLRQNPPTKVDVNDQLLKGQSGEDLFSYVLGLEYLKPQVTLRWAGKDIEQLSPGERGTLLLVFYLLIDKSDVPLVIDQPEENLDNQTVVDFLVPSVKEAKERRQIVLVTHNPNLAVVCDADQVICASLDKNDGNRITYQTGAIENPEINDRIVDILEGTRRAFDNRDGKYHAEKTQSRPRHKALPR